MEQNELQQRVRDILTQHLVEHGMRCTPERYAILRTIYGWEGHFSADDIYLRMESQFRVSRASVYNTLDLLVELGLVVRHTFTKIISYERCYGVRDHFHQVCTRCGKVKEVAAEPVSRALDNVRYSRFRAQNITICAFGLCATCQAAITKGHNRFLREQAEKKQEKEHSKQINPRKS